jgi:hypothetical protein
MLILLSSRTLLLLGSAGIGWVRQVDDAAVVHLGVIVERDRPKLSADLVEFGEFGLFDFGGFGSLNHRRAALDRIVSARWRDP